MVHAREAHNPADFHVEATRVNPWNDPRVSDEDGVRYSLETSTLYGTPARVAEASPSFARPACTTCSAR